MTAFPLDHVVESQQFDRELLETVFQTADLMKADLQGERQYAKQLEGKIWHLCSMNRRHVPAFPLKAQC